MPYKMCMKRTFPVNFKDLALIATSVVALGTITTPQAQAYSHHYNHCVDLLQEVVDGSVDMTARQLYRGPIKVWSNSTNKCTIYSDQMDTVEWATEQATFLNGAGYSGRRTICTNCNPIRLR